MVNALRRQLTLFVDEKDAENIEKVRHSFNIQQSKLIKSHVTLCKEDEIVNLEQIITHLTELQLKTISIDFDKVIRFEGGKGVLIPAKGNNNEFHKLRKFVLQGLNNKPRKHEPHITLMHPRNSTCTDAIFKRITREILPTRLEFKKISLIEQKEGGEWEILKDFDLEKKLKMF